MDIVARNSSDALIVKNATWCLASDQNNDNYFSSPISNATTWCVLPHSTILLMPVLYTIVASLTLYFRSALLLHVSAVLCVLSWMTRAKLSEQTACEYFCKDIYSYIISSACHWVCFVFHTTITHFVVVSMLLLSLFNKFWWCQKLNMVKDMTVGFEHLARTAKSRGKTVEAFAAERMRKRDPGNLPPVFPNGWIPLLESRDLTKQEAKSVIALGRQFAVFRSSDGAVHVLDAFCPHLGANMAIGGKVIGNCIECPFHGWQFDGPTGNCVSIPYAERVPDVARTRSWNCCEANGCIYVWYDAEEGTPTWNMIKIPQICEGKWLFRGRTEHIVYCHIQEIPENGADVAHLHQIHSHSIMSGNRVGQCSRRWSFMKHSWQPKWEPCTEPDSLHMADMSLTHEVEIFSWRIPFCNLNVDIKQIGPASVHLYMKTFWISGVIVQNVIPEGPVQQRVVHHFYAAPRVPQWVANTLLWMEGTMIERDVMIWNNKKFVKNPVLVKEDKLISRYRRWYSQFYSENSPTLQDLQERGNIDW